MPGLVGGIIVIAVIVLVILASCIKIVPQAQAVVLERLGAYKETWNVGIHFKVPLSIRWRGELYSRSRWQISHRSLLSQRIM